MLGTDVGEFPLGTGGGHKGNVNTKAGEAPRVWRQRLSVSAPSACRYTNRCEKKYTLQTDNQLILCSRYAVHPKDLALVEEPP